MIPRFRPIIAAWVRSLAPSLERMFSDLALDGFFADRELRGNLFVGIPFGNQPQHTHFCRGQRVIGGMLGKLVGGLGGKRLFPGMNARMVSSSSLCKLFFSR